ncbi:MAG: TolC family protein [Alphaproteobacteria bacterium]
MSGIWVTAANAQDMRARLEELLTSDSLIEAAKRDQQGATERQRVTEGNNWPTLNINSSVGREDQANVNANDTLLTARQLTLTVTQNLWDFGATDAGIERSKIEQREFALREEIARQDLLLQALVAHLNVLQTREVVAFALKSEDRLAEQAQVESDRIEAGSGAETDLLQVRSRLAGAKIRRVTAQREAAIAQNLFNRVYGYTPEAVTLSEIPELPANAIPASVDEAVELALGRNMLMRVARLRTDQLLQTAKQTEAESYYPNIDLIGEIKYKNDVDGTEGFERDAVGKVELSFPFNLGLTAINTVKAADLAHEAGIYRVNDLQAQIEQQVRDAWENYRTAVQSLTLATEQVDLTADFLDLAKEERKIGKRSLIDVITGETLYLDAQADAVATERTVEIAGFTLLSLISHLSIDTVKIVPYSPSSGT